jgi:uncharacterized peroxidase-related enzyme
MMTRNFPVLDETSAPAAARPILAAVKQQFGFVPNLVGVLAQSPAAVEAYATLVRIFAASSLTAAAQHVVLQTVNLCHECHYCVPAHSTVARLSGIPDGVDAALRAGRPLADDKLEALRRFTRSVVERRGRLGERDTSQLIGAGFTYAQLLEIIVGVAMKTLSNYVNHVAETPLDAAFMKHDEAAR